MPSRSVDLTERETQFIDSSVAEGRFQDASEAVRAGLRLLEHEQIEYEAKVAWLRGAIQESIDCMERGDYQSFDSVDALADHIHEIGAEVSRELRDGLQLGEEATGVAGWTHAARPATHPRYFAVERGELRQISRPATRSLAHPSSA